MEQYIYRSAEFDFAGFNTDHISSMVEFIQFSIKSE
jgi:hypothetical protein